MVDSVAHDRWSPADRDRMILLFAKSDGYGVEIVIEQEPGSAGKSVADYLRRMLAGYTVHIDRPTGNKEVRAQPFAAQCEAGNVCLAEGPWNSCFIEELCLFPNGTHDDQVDASSGAFLRLARQSYNYKPATFLRAPRRSLERYGIPGFGGRERLPCRG